MTLPTHSPLGASSAERWLNCPGSVSLLARLNIEEGEEPEYRREGTAAHALASECLLDGRDAWERIGDPHTNGVEISAEMAEAVQEYLNHVRHFVGKIYVEEHLCSSIHELMYGTVDFACVVGSCLILRDFKYGQGVDVLIEENPQLMYYAYLLLERHPEVEHVSLGVVQPRIEMSIKIWTTTADFIRGWVDRELAPTIRAIGAGDDQSLDAGPWCRFCPAKTVCPLMIGMFGAAATANIETCSNQSDEMLGREYQKIAAVKMYLSALIVEVERRLRTGREVPGAKLVQKIAERVFRDGADEVFLEEFKNDAFTSPVLLSPAKMEKLGARAKELVRGWAYKPDTGLTVAPADDGRPAVRIRTAAETFGDTIQNRGEML